MKEKVNGFSLDLQAVKNKFMKDQDWEHEALKDFIYLQEELEMLKQEMLEERLPAKIIVIDKTRTNEPKQSNVLLFPSDTEWWI